MENTRLIRSSSPQPRQTRPGQHQRGKFAFIQLAQPRQDIPAHRLHPHPRKQRPQLKAAALGRAADRLLRVKRILPLRQHEHVE